MRISAVLMTAIFLLTLASSGLQSRQETLFMQNTNQAQLGSLAEATLQMAYSEASGREDPAYHFRSNGVGFAAANPSHDLIIDITDNTVGFSVDNDSWQLLSIEPVTGQNIDKNRLTLHRDGYDEWYVNGPVGLQQGFTLYKPSDIEFTIGGTLTTVASAQAINIGDDLIMSGLMAFDVEGSMVPVEFQQDGNKLVILYDDTNAIYPVTIDPWVQQAELLASDAVAGDSFGGAVALDGDTALIGAYLDDDNGGASGSAYVFTRSGAIWTQQAKLLPADGASDDWFGWSVALDGDTAVVGTPLDDDYGDVSGSAYVFIRSGTTWSQQAKLLPADGANGDQFGRSVAMAGDTAVVGARFDDDNGFNSGSAYVFIRSGTTWSQQAKLLSDDGISGDSFGIAVALDGDTSLVSGGGSAYVFIRSGTTWSQQAKLLTTSGSGWPAALDGDTALVGSPFDDVNGSDSGSAYVFTRSGTVWSQEATLLPGDGNAFDNFGTSVALDGNTALIGARKDSDNGYQSGSSYVFTRSGTTWTEQVKLMAAGGGSYEESGASVAISGNTALVGAPAQALAFSFSGSAYVYYLDAVPLIASASCNGDNLDVTISNGDGPYNITSTFGPSLPLNGVSAGTHTIIGPALWQTVTVTETTGGGESINLGDFNCGTPGITLTESGGSTDVDEDNPGTTDSYAIVLHSSPEVGATVTIELSSNTTTGVTANPNNLQFDINNWNIEQTVTVTVVDDAVDEASPHTDTISHTVRTTGSLYSGLLLSDVTVSIIDNEEPLVASAACNAENLEVTITDGDGPYDIIASAGINTPVNGVSTGVTTINGPEKWDNLTVTESTGDFESINFGQFKCRTDERPVPQLPPHLYRTTNPHPYFQWTAITNANNYRVFLFDNKVVANRTVDIRQNSGGPTNLTLNEILMDGRYFWRVRGRQNRIWSLWSVRFTLFKDPITPTAPVPTIELNTPSGDVSSPTAAPTFPPPPNSR